MLENPLKLPSPVTEAERKHPELHRGAFSRGARSWANFYFKVACTAAICYGDQSVSLAWDRAPSHTNLSKFVVKYGFASGSYTFNQTVSPNFTTTTVNNLQPGITYYFVVTAVNQAQLESDPSNELSYTVPYPKPLPQKDLRIEKEE